MNKERSYEVGNTIIYNAFGGERRVGRVIEKSDDIKNGRPGFVMVDAAGNEWWGYDSQIC